MRIGLVGLCLLFPVFSFSQNYTDTIVLREITITSYLKNRSMLHVPASAAVVDSAVMRSYTEQSLVNVVNTVSGVRMEERSPGSYRLSIRGSVLRSPFGIRNVKMYIDEFPLTDATGNTYFNLLDGTAVRRMEIWKGPDGSLYGANSGGVVRLDVFPVDSMRVNALTTAGSYRGFHDYVCLQHNRPVNHLSITKSWLHTDGYRENSSLDRRYYQVTDRFSYGRNAEVRFLVLHTDLDYRTPGGLTLQQYREQPKLARLPTASLRGANEQHAGVNNSTYYAGILNRITWYNRFDWVVAFFGSDTRFENPFITNWEQRHEKNGGVRSWVEMNGHTNLIKWSWMVGTEWQKNFSRIRNYGNDGGMKDTLQQYARFKVLNGFVFAAFNADVWNRFHTSLSLSYNANRFMYSNQLQLDRNITTVFRPQFMPRVSLSFDITRQWVWRIIVSKGYSPPTLAEVYPSGSLLNTDLQPEQGINYETGTRWYTTNTRFMIDISAYTYLLKNAIVRRQDELGNEFFINAGGTHQQGVEIQAVTDIIKNETNWIRNVQLRSSYTLTYYVFSNYTWNETDYSENRVTGVPENTVVSGMTIVFPYFIYVYAQHNYTSSIPLNDGNTEFADAYHLVQVKLGWKYALNEKYRFEVFMGVDNLLNETYSLGNDLNAIGGRYYNAAMPRNFTLGGRLLIR